MGTDTVTYGRDCQFELIENTVLHFLLLDGLEVTENAVGATKRSDNGERANGER